MASRCAIPRRTRGVEVVVMAMMVMMAGYVESMNVVEVFRDLEVGDQGQGGVALMWGIADTTASAGRLFRYHIPSDAFKGPVQSYEVVEAGKDALPSWLRFDAGENHNVLQGLPTPTDAGQLYLQVTARGPRGSSASDVFILTVLPDIPSLSSGEPLRVRTSGPEAVRCQRQEPETVATLLLDEDLHTMPAERRLALLEAFLHHMGLGEGMVKMVPAVGPLHDDSALVTGTGDANGKPQHVGVWLSWLVGCGKVERGHFPVLHKLDDDSSSGKMGKALGVPVVGWRVTNTRLQQQQQQHVLKRRRRQARATPTPVITMAPPTGTDDADTMTRPVIDMSSPMFTIEPSPTLPEMPKTTTTPPPTTTPKAEKPDEVHTSRKPEVLPPVTKTDPLPTTTQKPTKKPMPPTEECVKPQVKMAFSKKMFLVGEVVDFQIPENLFDACGMGGTSHTKLTLFLLDEEDKRRVIPETFWLQFDQRSQTVRGLAMEGDVGRYPMTLVAMLKTHDYITTFDFEVVVRKAKGRKSRVNHELSMTVDTDYDKFMGSLDMKLDLASKVAGVFGDANASALTVTSIKRGSVVYAFTNNTLAGGGCPVGEVTNLADKLVTADGQLNPEAMKKLEPWVLTGAAVAPEGDCEGDPSFPTRSATAPATAKPDMPDATEKPMTTTTSKNMTGVASAGKTGDDNIWITTVVPAVVIVAILLVALLVACILYRKKRKGKMNLEEQNTFVNKGAPVIFPDELDEKPSDSSKPLLIEGSPPAAPPDYQRGESESSDPATKETTPPTDEVDAEIEIDATSPLYQPPPPVPASSGKQARPNVQQPYRSQPPEIHP